MRFMRPLSLWIYSLIFLTSITAAGAEEYIRLSQDDALKIAVKIWYNESGGSVLGLTSWNLGEEFASVGIGHFIWYPAHSHGGTFPQLIKFMQARNVKMPYWLQTGPGCPWNSRSQFQRALYAPSMQELRQFLLATIPWQAQFMVYRLNQSLDHIFANVNPSEKEYLQWQLQRIAETPQGVYALIDYVNFKGDGVGYVDSRGNGWGLLQVLEAMQYAPVTQNPLESFAWAADQILTRRVADAPPYKSEKRWLAGWRKRLQTYIYPS